jgi:hypothetical protein
VSETATPPADTRGELIGRLKSKLKEYATRLRSAEAERDAAITDRDAAAKRADEAATKFNADPLKGEVDRLKGEIRSGRHRAAFDEAAVASGAPKESLDLLWRESGWKADADEVDAAAIGKAVEGLKARPDIARLFGDGQQQATPERKPAPAQGQGGRVGEGMRIKATSDNLRDADWCHANRAALREKRVDLID